MDAAEIEATAQHLAALGCTETQIERHLKSLLSIAGRAAARAHGQAKQAKQGKPQRQWTYRLTQDQIDALLPKLRERQWRWTQWPCKYERAEDWVGHPILSVPGVPAFSYNEVGHLVGGVLEQLRSAGLIARVAIAPHRVGGFRVAVVPQPQRKHRERLHEPQHKPRVRLQDAERHERAALTGFCGPSHTTIAGALPASQRPTSGSQLPT